MSIFTQSKRSFENQLPGEKTILVVRKHWIVLLIPIIIIFLMLFLPFIVYPLLLSLGWRINIGPLFYFIFSVYLLFLWNLLFYNIAIYILNTLTITNKRIIENEQNGLFKHKVDELGISKIQDVSAKVYGFIPELLKYGDIELQTAGSEKKFYFRRFPNPYQIKKTIKDINQKAHPWL